MTPSYLRNRHSDSGKVTDHRDWQIPLTRRFRSLKLWFVLRTYGTEGLKDHISRHIHLGKLFHSLVLTRHDLFNVVAEPAFALVVLTIIPPPPSRHAESPPTQNDLTREIYEMINSRGEIYLTSTVVQGTFAIRFLCAIPQAEEKWIIEAFRVLVETTEETLEKCDRPNGLVEPEIQEETPFAADDLPVTPNKLCQEGEFVPNGVKLGMLEARKAPFADAAADDLLVPFPPPSMRLARRASL